MRLLIMATLTLGLSVPAFGQTHVCSGAMESPYPALVATDHDHRRVAPRTSSPTKPFTGFYAAFDDGDDDDGDGRQDERLNPEFVVYELRGLAPNSNGDYAEPAVLISRPSRWYASPELLPIASLIEGVGNRRIDDSYRRAGEVRSRGHLAKSYQA